MFYISSCKKHSKGVCKHNLSIRDSLKESFIASKVKKREGEYLLVSRLH